ncbi:MAG TPA: GntR family transcriptional regulator [Bryobacteraceae bacterium]|jgi:GntR family transcriptional regulator|nr:GntR family transcriptional regulator [Bryobacteraceae bacterium]
MTGTNKNGRFEFKLDVRSGVPVYRQIIDQVLGGIAAGSLKAGDQLPTVRQLAVDLAINPNTVVRAYRELEIREVLATQQGTGTFITEKKPQPDDLERRRRVAQLAGDLLARAGAEGISLQELVDYFDELQNEQNRRS